MEELRDMPNRPLVDYLVAGMQQGFRIGFNRQVSTTKMSVNMKSALTNSEPELEFLSKESQALRIIGPLDPVQFPHIHISRFGVIPKGSQQGKWRLILDLSLPEHHSLNDGIDPA